MTFPYPAPLSLIVSQTILLAEIQPATPFYLLAIDRVITALGLLLLAAVAALSWSKSPSLNPAARVHAFRVEEVLLAVLVYCSALLVLSGVMNAIGNPDTVVARLLANNGALLAGSAACLIIASRRFGGGLRGFLWGRQTSWPVTTLYIAVFTVIGWAVCPLLRDATVSLILFFSPGFSFDPHPTIRALHEGPSSAAVVAALWIGATLITPAAEELFFRGLLQNALALATASRIAAVTFTALAFGVVHISQPHALAALVFLGVLLGIAYERTGAILAPFMIHAMFNLKTLIWEALS